MASDEFRERLRRIDATKRGLPLENTPEAELAMAETQAAEVEPGADVRPVPPLGFAVLAGFVGLSAGAILCIGLNMFLARSMKDPYYWETLTGLIVLLGGLVGATIYGVKHLSEKPFVFAGAAGAWVGIIGVAILLALLL